MLNLQNPSLVALYNKIPFEVFAISTRDMVSAAFNISEPLDQDAAEKEYLLCFIEEFFKLCLSVYYPSHKLLRNRRE
jgi:hypothetical protein